MRLLIIVRYFLSLRRRDGKEIQRGHVKIVGDMGLVLCYERE